ncbi:MAG TPA: hypothetical protein VG013_24865 [Gemmataceae bacterium]|nr:hypothetical protein [Gemmataceae bacterium]
MAWRLLPLFHDHEWQFGPGVAEDHGHVFRPGSNLATLALDPRFPVFPLQNVAVLAVVAKLVPARQVVGMLLGRGAQLVIELQRLHFLGLAKFVRELEGQSALFLRNRRLESVIL